MICLHVRLFKPGTSLQAIWLRRPALWRAQSVLFLYIGTTFKLQGLNWGLSRESGVALPPPSSLIPQPITAHLEEHYPAYQLACNSCVHPLIWNVLKLFHLVYCTSYTINTFQSLGDYQNNINMYMQVNTHIYNVHGHYIHVQTDLKSCRCSVVDFGLRPVFLKEQNVMLLGKCLHACLINSPCFMLTYNNITTLDKLEPLLENHNIDKVYDVTYDIKCDPEGYGPRCVVGETQAGRSKPDVVIVGHRHHTKPFNIPSI